MKANELRIGNWVLYEGKAEKLYDFEHDLSLVSFETSPTGTWSPAINHSGIFPIPLTEEWLLRLGIQFGFDFAEVFSVRMEDNGGLTVEQYSEGRFELPHIKYVHQLQNLYFALTGQELEVKELVK